MPVFLKRQEWLYVKNSYGGSSHMEEEQNFWNNGGGCPLWINLHLLKIPMLKP